MALQDHLRTIDGKLPLKTFKNLISPRLKPRSDGNWRLIKTHKSMICFASLLFASETHGSFFKSSPSATCININHRGTVKTPKQPHQTLTCMLWTLLLYWTLHDPPWYQISPSPLHKLLTDGFLCGSLTGILFFYILYRCWERNGSQVLRVSNNSLDYELKNVKNKQDNETKSDVKTLENILLMGNTNDSMDKNSTGQGTNTGHSPIII